MSHAVTGVDFDSPSLMAALPGLSDVDLDALPYGVIGFDAHGHVTRYNAYESRAAAFPRDEVLGQHVFVELAPCFNNYLVAGRFDEAREHGTVLDETMPYVLTFRMRPTRVRLRLLSTPDQATRFIVVQRALGASA